MNMTMNTKHTKLTLIAVAVGLVLGASASALAASSDSQTVSYTVESISEIAVSGTPTFTLLTPSAGSNFAPANASGTYAISANTADASTKKITAAINAEMETGLTLKVNMDAPGTGSTAGIVTLGIASADVVTGITDAAISDVAINYTLEALMTAKVASNLSKTVTFTIVDV